jgi:hypothetical protein
MVAKVLPKIKIYLVFDIWAMDIKVWADAWA